MSFDRRQVLGFGAGLASLSAGLTGMGSMAALAQTSPGFKQFKLGDLTLTALHDGLAERPLEDGFVKNAKLADVQTFLSQAGLAADKLTINFSNLVIDDGKTRTMIDSLTGATLAPSAGKLTENLKAAGIDPASINTVLLSHFHPDHINGLAPKEGMAVFANAEIRVPEAEWAFWMDDARMNAAPEAMKGGFQNVRRVLKPLEARIRPYKPEEEVVANIKAIDASGHTPGHTVFAIASGSQQLMFMADTTNNPVIFAANPEWQIIFDMDGDKAVETRKRLLDRAEAEKAMVFFYHAPFPAVGMIEKNGTGYRFAPAA
jgi:glyoxylase-like metal-dependent hydrolase (beta-lactamase superfamily II)